MDADNEDSAAAFDGPTKAAGVVRHERRLARLE
jgi:hypothetical protein